MTTQSNLLFLKYMFTHLLFHPDLLVNSRTKWFSKFLPMRNLNILSWYLNIIYISLVPYLTLNNIRYCNYVTHNKSSLLCYSRFLEPCSLIIYLVLIPLMPQTSSQKIFLPFSSSLLFWSALQCSFSDHWSLPQALYFLQFYFCGCW